MYSDNYIYKTISINVANNKSNKYESYIVQRSIEYRIHFFESENILEILKITWSLILKHISLKNTLKVFYCFLDIYKMSFLSV